MGFGNYSPQAEITPEIKAQILELEQKSKDPASYLKNAFDFVLGRWYAVRYKAVTELLKLFRTDLVKIWREPGYAHCTTQNFILYNLLVHSRYFKPEDIKAKNVFLNFVPHQYLEVKVGDNWVEIDPAATSCGITTYGKRGSFFG